jgi:DNA-directed RNA polymerase subunit RPC12/RpoP
VSDHAKAANDVFLPDEPSSDVAARGSSRFAGRTEDEGQGRVFPCAECGADLTFHIGVQSLKCPFCGHVQPLQFEDGAAVVEQDFHAMLARVRELRENRKPVPTSREDGTSNVKEIRCGSCGAQVAFTGTLTSSECAYCGSPIQRENVHDAEDRVAVDGVLPFLIERSKAEANLKEWVQSRWFAPNEFRQRGVEGRFNGIYLPYWTYDSMTWNRFSGERGEHYWVTERDSKGQERRVRHTRWWPASGTFERFFDDVLVVASRGLPSGLIESLEPWPLDRTLPFQQQMLAGFLAKTYDVELDAGFQQAKSRIDAAIRAEVQRRIGGDEQRIHSITTRHNAITFKHLLLPVWMLAYRYHDKAYQVVVNAGTGEVQGERPYSWVKIVLTVAAVAGVVATIAAVASR